MLIRIQHITAMQTASSLVDFKIIKVVSSSSKKNSINDIEMVFCCFFWSVDRNHSHEMPFDLDSKEGVPSLLLEELELSPFDKAHQPLSPMKKTFNSK